MQNINNLGKEIGDDPDLLKARMLIRRKELVGRWNTLSNKASRRVSPLGKHKKMPIGNRNTATCRRISSSNWKMPYWMNKAGFVATANKRSHLMIFTLNIFVRKAIPNAIRWITAISWRHAKNNRANLCIVAAWKKTGLTVIYWSRRWIQVANPVLFSCLTGKFNLDLIVTWQQKKPSTDLD